MRLQAAGGALDAAGRRQLKAALKQHGGALAGPLAGVLKKRMKFRLGFLSECTLKSGVTLDPAVLGSPWWSTVEVLDVGWDDTLTRTAALPSLRELSGAILRDDIRAWLPRPRLTSLSVLPGGESNALAARVRAILDARDLLPALTSLELVVTRRSLIGGAPALLDGELAGQIKHLGVYGTAGATRFLAVDGVGQQRHDRAFIELLIAQLPALERWPSLVSVGANIVYGGGAPVRYVVERGVGGRRVNVVAAGQLHGWWRVLADNLGFLAGGLSAGDTLAVTAKVDDPAAWLAPVEAAAASGVVLDISGVRQR